MIDEIKTTNSFASRVEDVLKGEFKQPMSRALIMLALFEANRCLLSSFPGMKPFQRKIAVLSTALDIIQTLDFLTDEQKTHLSTMTRKNDTKPVIAKMAFNRAHKLENEVKTCIIPDIEKLLGEGKSHDQICDEFLQMRFEKVTEKSGPVPPFWSYRRLPIFLIYLVYYRNLEEDPSIFDAVAPRPLAEMPSKRPENLCEYVLRNWSWSWNKANTVGSNAEGAKGDPNISAKKDFEMSIGKKQVSTASFEDRLHLLMGIKVRMELLKQMEDEDVFPKRRVVKEKRMLIKALPPPISYDNRRTSTMVTKLHLELLKGMKDVLPKKMYANQMKTLFVGLAPLPTSDVNGSSKDADSDNDKQAKEGDTDVMVTERGWEEVGGIDEMNSAVSFIA
ncbi:predicted protein [Thalassiosira pseudonana CCMP1335]|uniref:Uncharacterized protein n=1 Tax=Thalassiosira pseudonana TaxID=35128 RepID=B8CAD1_THAPS|nr:predicted protein [Thalassiosira pseudonana CCMP1335]EED89660.1 predicted protein [Thalassiosira pseudonana CCMP1335]|eukprot:scaffold90_cov184-Alexandrium_tamarense.AAC.8